MVTSFKMSIFAVLPAIIVLSGCSQNNNAAQPKEPGVVEYMTGAASLQNFQRAKSRINEINKRGEERREAVDEQTQ